jgi:hypothetical protein
MGGIVVDIFHALSSNCVILLKFELVDKIAEQKTLKLRNSNFFFSA